MQERLAPLLRAVEIAAFVAGEEAAQQASVSAASCAETFSNR
jgi:hypothetical protein